ncbi:MAG: CDP-alcohol [Prolixibacteraceae bacterium]|nr:MAG: CDP-alcohol [Prolixibacteraceae bacterium]
MKQIICPISNEYVNERVTRINALLAILLTATAFLLNSVLFLIFLTADFYTRAFTNARYSPISYLSHRMVNALNLNKKETDKAPKIFAARIGFIMSLAITVLFLLQLNTAAFAVGGILIFFASLEFVLAVCMGCIVYNYLVLPFFKQ